MGRQKNKVPGSRDFFLFHYIPVTDTAGNTDIQCANDRRTIKHLASDPEEPKWIPNKKIPYRTRNMVINDRTSRP